MRFFRNENKNKYNDCNIHSAGLKNIVKTKLHSTLFIRFFLHGLFYTILKYHGSPLKANTLFLHEFFVTAGIQTKIALLIERHSKKIQLGVYWNHESLGLCLHTCK